MYFALYGFDGTNVRVISLRSLLQASWLVVPRFSFEGAYPFPPLRGVVVWLIQRAVRSFYWPWNRAGYTGLYCWWTASRVCTGTRMGTADPGLAVWLH